MLPRHALPGLVLLATAIACGDPYKHTNPYDPVVSVDMTISGPDTLFSAFENGVYSAQTTPVFADTAIRWSAGGIAYIGRTATLIAPPPPLWPATGTTTISMMIGAIDTLRPTAQGCQGDCSIVPTQFYRHTAMKTVIFTQRITHIRLRCPDAHACDTLSAGGTWTVFADALDSLDQPLYISSGLGGNSANGQAQASFTLRDSTIASRTSAPARAITVTALKPGSTWIVGSRAATAGGFFLDSLQLVVH